MPAKQAAVTTYNRVRAAELTLQRACLALGIPLALVQPLASQKVEQAWQAMQQAAA